MRRWLADQRGGVAVAGAAAGLLACVTAAAVIDGASMALYARRLQTAADLAALAAARDLPRADAAARATAEANLGADIEVLTTTGVYRAQADIEAKDRFRPAPLETADAAEVTVSGVAPLWLGGVILDGEPVRLKRTGRAAVVGPPMAMLTIGSRLVALNGGLANQVLSAFTGSSVSLTAIDYQALAGADVDLLTFTDLLATELDVRVGDYDALLSKEVDAGRLLEVVERASTGADTALAKLARAADGRRLQVGELVGLETDAPEALRAALAGRVSVLDIAMATLEISGGGRQARLDLPLRAGLASIDAWLAIGERPNRSPWLTVDDDGDILVRTAQARLYLRVKTSDAIARLGQVSAPFLIELAPAEARLAAIRCTPDREVDVTARPGVARLRLAEVNPARLDDFKSALSVRPATLVDVAGLVRVTGQADLDMASSSTTRLTFKDADIAAGRPRTVKSTGFVASPATVLLQTLDLRVQALGLPLGLSGVGDAVAALLRPLAGVLDAAIDEALATLGLSLGEADVSVPHAVCPRNGAAPVLVG